MIRLKRDHDDRSRTIVLLEAEKDREIGDIMWHNGTPTIVLRPHDLFLRLSLTDLKDAIELGMREYEAYRESQIRIREHRERKEAGSILF